jgi:hypothetical protein
LEGSLRSVCYQPDSLFPLSGRPPAPDDDTVEDKANALRETCATRGWKIILADARDLMLVTNRGVLEAKDYQEVVAKRAYLDGLNTVLAIPAVRIDQAEAKSRRKP